MAHNCRRLKRFFRKITGRRQKQPEIPPAAEHARTTPEDPYVTDGNHIQQEQLKAGYSAASPTSPAAEPAESKPGNPSSTGRQHVQQDGFPATAPTPPAAEPASITPDIPSSTGGNQIQQEHLKAGYSTTSLTPPAAKPAKFMPDDPSSTGRQHAQHKLPSDSYSATPTAAKSLWDRAYDTLAKENPNLVQKYDELLEKEQIANSVSNEKTPHDLDTRSDRARRLDTVIQTGLQRMEDNKTTVTIAGQKIVLEDQIARAAGFLLWGKDLIDSAVRVSPEASLVWAGVSLIFPLLINPTTAAEANRDGFFYVTSRLRYYIAMEPMLCRLGQNARVDEALIAEAEVHLVDLYRVILDFQLSSVLRFYRSRFRVYVRDTVTSKDWKQTLLDIKTQEQTVYRNFGQINELVTRQELELLNETSEKLHSDMENLLPIAIKHLSVSTKQLAIEEEAKQERLLAEQRKCLQSFWLTDNGKGASYDWYKDRVERRVEGTCEWFLQHQNYRKWLSQKSGPLLVSADPGCGKSVLAKYLIDDGLAQPSATVCYFFFKDQDQNTIRQALCALLHQLFTKKRPLIQHAMELYNDMGAALVQSEIALWRILRDAVRDPQAGPVIFVIDALDECDESQLRSFISNLKDIFCDKQLADAKFKVLMTSRPYDQVVRKFRSLQDIFSRIHIPGEDAFETISKEINRVIHHRVELLAQEHGLSDSIKSSLESKLLAIGHRTYLWVYLVFDYLDEEGFKKTGDGIDAAIHTLPETVNQAYNQILNRFQKDKTVKTVQKVLGIILAARRPLTVSEMNIAMSLDGQGRGRSIYDLDLEQDVDFKSHLRSLCGLFVNVHHDKIYFLHQTAREFLIQSSTPAPVPSTLQWHRSITTRHAHSFLAEICMLYLDRLNSTHTKTFDKDDHHGALLDYSVEYWGDHCREADFEEGSAMVDLASGLCTPVLTSHSVWANIISGRYNNITGSFKGILVASQLGLTSVTELLLSKGADIEAKDSQDRTAVMLAAESGHEAVTRLLLEKRANVKARSINGRTALMLAAGSGHEAVTRLLLEHGVDVDAKDADGRTALMLVAGQGHEAIMRLLITEAKAWDDDSWTPLMLVADSVHVAVTRLLLEHSVDVDARDADGRTALMFVAGQGHEAVTRLLLDNGADAEAKNDLGKTALMTAAESGHEAVTRLLLERGVNIEARNDLGRTALGLAAESGHDTITRLLLDHSARAVV